MTLAGSAAAESYFTEVVSPFGTQPCNGGGCYTNYLIVVDIDNDNKLDVLVPNSGSGDQPLVVYQNKGDATFTNVSATAVGGYASAVRVVAVADITGDGFVDFYAPNAKGAVDKFFINDGTGKFVDEAATRLPGVSSHSGAARFVDIDNDGDLDLLVGDSVGGGGGTVAHLYFNDGTGKFTESATPLPLSSGGSQPYDFDLLDCDGDFDLDLFVDMHSGKGLLWKNDGTGVFTDVTVNLPPQSGLKYGPVTCDVDGDGDLDIWQDNSGPGYTEQLMINDGTGKYTDETAARVTGNPGADDNGVTCVDIDGDGDLDAVVTALGQPERLLKNDGTGHFVLETGAFPSPGDSSLWADFGDLNGDGKLDLVTGQGESGTFIERAYIGSGASVVDITAPRIRAVETVSAGTPDDSPVLRFAVSDNATTDTGPRLQKAYVKLISPAAPEVKASFIGGDMFRAVLPAQAGDTMVTFQACAKDRQGNEGCSAMISYVVGGVGPATTTGVASGGTGGAGGGMGGTGGVSPVGPGGTGGATSSAGGNGTGGNAGTGATNAGGNGTGGTGGDFTLDPGGCGCAIPGSDPRSSTLALTLFGALTMLARRRKTRPHRQ